jgi:hypothetical protein
VVACDNHPMVMVVEEQDKPDRFLARPPGRWFHGITAVVLVVILWGDSYTGLWWPSVPLYPLSLLLGVVWLVRVTPHLSAGRRGGARIRNRMLAVLPALVALTIWGSSRTRASPACRTVPMPPGTATSCPPDQPPTLT